MEGNDKQIDDILSEAEQKSAALPPDPAPAAPHTPGGGKKKKRHRYARWVRVLTSVCAALMILIGALCIGGGSYVWWLLDRIDYVDEDEMNQMGSFPDSAEDLLEQEREDQEEDGYESLPPDVSEMTPDDVPSVADIPVRGNTDDVLNVLLLGIDGRTGYAARSDANIILSINKKHKTIKLVSIMRDLQVLVPGYDIDGDGRDDLAKFNVAFRGGFNRTFRTIEQNFRLKIDRFVAVNFLAFPVVVDALGGIRIELTDAEVAHVPAPGCHAAKDEPGFVPISDKGGVFDLDGFQTLQYARIRKLAGSDFSRVQRQQKVINLLLEKVLDSNVFTLLGLVNQLFGEVQTNFNKSELLKYATDAVTTYSSYDIVTSYRIPQDNMYRNGTLRGSSVLVLNDQRQSVLHLHDYLYA